MHRSCLLLTASLTLTTLPAAGQLRVRHDGNVAYLLTVGDEVYSDRGVSSVRGSESPPQWWLDFMKEHTLAKTEDYCYDLYTEPVFARPQVGDRTVVLDMGGAAQLVQLVELAPGSETEWHGYGWEGEALFVVIQGRGETEYREMSGKLPSTKYAWKKDTLFGIAVDHQVKHYNRDPNTTARMLVVVGYGINLYSGAREEVEESAAALPQTMYPGHYVEDLASHPVPVRDPHGNQTAFFNLISTVGHRTHPYVQLSELTAEQAYPNRHAKQPIFMILKGAGYDVWSQAEDLAAFRADLAAGRAHKSAYEEGTLCGVPADPPWHQHASANPEAPVRYLAIFPRGEYEREPTSPR